MALPQDPSTDPDCANHTSSAALISDAAIDFLSRNAATDDGAPWMMYLPFQNIHSPYTCEKRFRDMYSQGGRFTPDEMTMFGYLTEMDFAIKPVLDKLRAVPSQYARSVIIFSSDNGAPADGEGMDHKQGNVIARNFPFRGAKTQIWDGGTRVAGFVHSPLLPKAVQGTVSHELFHVTDWAPTILALTKAGKGSHQPFDGYDIWPSLSQASPSPRTEVLYNVNPIASGQAGWPKAGLRVGPYKVLSWGYTIAGIGGGNTTGPCHVCAGAPDAPAEFSSGPVLFNLDEDPSESNNVARQHPGVLAKLLARLKVLALESVEPQQWDPPYQGENYYCKDCPKHPHGAGTGPGIPWGAWCKDNGEDREQARPALLGSWDAFQGPSRTRMRQSVCMF